MNYIKRKILFRGLHKQSYEYKDLPLELKLDHDFIKEGLKHNYEIGQYFPEILKQDKDFFKFFLPIDCRIFKYMDTELKKDKEILDIMLTEYFLYSKSYRKSSVGDVEDQESILEYVPQLKNCNNKKLIYKAILLRSNNHTNDYIVLKTICNNMSDKLQKDVPFLSLLIKVNYNVYKYLSPQMKDEGKIMIAALKASSGNIYQYFNEEFKNDPFFILYMNKQFPISKEELGFQLNKTIGEDSIESYFSKLLLKEQIENTINELDITIPTVSMKRKKI